MVEVTGHDRQTPLELVAACFAYQVRRFGRAAAVVPELYEGQSPDMLGWPTA